MLECWLMSPDLTDPKSPNRCDPNIPLHSHQLSELGIFYRHFPLDDLHDLPALIDRLKQQLQYAGHDIVRIAPSQEADGRAVFEANLTRFFTEHIHEDEEVRLVLDGSGYFDVRNREDAWVRLRVQKGDLLILPAGLYHRFSVDTAECTRALRLFKENPKWEAIARPCETNTAREAYVRFLHTPRCSILGSGNETDVLLVSEASDLDGDLHARLAHSPVGTLAVLYFTGMALPATSGRSWCPDCAQVEEEVREGVRRLRLERKGTVFVQCDVERSSYVGNATHAYRTHPIIQLKGLPTVMIVEVRHADMVKEERNWWEYCDVILKTRNPTVDVLTQW